MGSIRTTREEALRLALIVGDEKKKTKPPARRGEKNKTPQFLNIFENSPISR
jgi:hypothetical protein